MTEAERLIHLAGAVMNRNRHACAFFNSREEEYGGRGSYWRTW